MEAGATGLILAAQWHVGVLIRPFFIKQGPVPALHQSMEEQTVQEITLSTLIVEPQRALVSKYYLLLYLLQICHIIIT